MRALLLIWAHARHLLLATRLDKTCIYMCMCNCATQSSSSTLKHAASLDLQDFHPQWSSASFPPLRIRSEQICTSCTRVGVPTACTAASHPRAACRPLPVLLVLLSACWRRETARVRAWAIPVWGAESPRGSQQSGDAPCAVHFSSKLSIDIVFASADLGGLLPIAFEAREGSVLQSLAGPELDRRVSGREGGDSHFRRPAIPTRCDA